MDKTAFILDIEWGGVSLPRLVGPFLTRKEAEEWAALNVGNGAWEVCPLACPYHRSRA